MEKIPITFFGSGPVAAKSLELLIDKFNIEAVITKPKPKYHKGDFPVISVAESNNIKVHTVSDKTELSRLIASNKVTTEVAILIDFGIIVSQDVINHFPRGIINSHFSILPEWRGADPITFSILSGQKQTGVSLMLLVEAMDEGPLLGFGTLELNGEEYSNELTNKLIELSTSLITDLVPNYLKSKDPKAVTLTQEESCKARGIDFVPTYSRKLNKNDGLMDFSKPAVILEREIRAFIEWPKSRTNLADIDVIITKAVVVNNSGKSGDFSIDEGKLFLYCSDKSLEIISIKPAGKSEMTAKSFIAGYKDRISK